MMFFSTQRSLFLFTFILLLATTNVVVVFGKKTTSTTPSKHPTDTTHSTGKKPNSTHPTGDDSGGGGGGGSGSGSGGGGGSGGSSGSQKLSEIWIPLTDEGIAKLYDGVFSLESAAKYDLGVGWTDRCNEELSKSGGTAGYMNWELEAAATRSLPENSCAIFIVRAKAACYTSAGKDLTQDVIKNHELSESAAKAFLPDMKTALRQHLQQEGKDVPACINT